MLRACRPVGLHLAVEVSVALLRGGVVREELDVSSQFFHDFVSLTGRSCGTRWPRQIRAHKDPRVCDLFVLCCTQPGSKNLWGIELLKAVPGLRKREI